MNDSNIIVHGMWIGTELSSIELLTIRSFINNGHEFYLWAYDEIILEPLDGLHIKPAYEVIPKEFVFSYKNKNKFGHGKGSYAGFSDIFRYKLLFEYGGWWVDMDITCLRPFDFDSPYVFRSHHDLNVVGNVLKCPKGSPLMKYAYDEAIAEIDAENTDWHKPIMILNKYIEFCQLQEYIKYDLSYADDWGIISKFIKRKVSYNDSYYFIHWMNEEWRSRYLSKKTYRYKSLLGTLMSRYKVNSKQASKWDYLLNYLFTSTFFENLRLLNVIQ